MNTGGKTILGIRQGATENATVVGELLGDLLDRGLDFTEPRLYILHGGKALTAAVKKHAGESPQANGPWADVVRGAIEACRFGPSSSSVIAWEG